MDLVLSFWNIERLVVGAFHLAMLVWFQQSLQTTNPELPEIIPMCTEFHLRVNTELSVIEREI